MDLSQLYKSKAPELEAGSAAPQVDATWARRQNSIMWTPMPKKYTAGASKYRLQAIEETTAEANAGFGARLHVVAELPKTSR